MLRNHLINDLQEYGHSFRSPAGIDWNEALRRIEHDLAVGNPLSVVYLSRLYRFGYEWSPEVPYGWCIAFHYAKDRGYYPWIYGGLSANATKDGSRKKRHSAPSPTLP